MPEDSSKPLVNKKPSPIIDNLEHINNPYQQSNFSVTPFFPANSSITDADTDFEYALKFLYAYNGSSATFNAYRREVERLLQWSWFVHQHCLIELKREDFESYIAFCINPPKSWIGLKNVARFKNKQGQRIGNPDWYPFVVSNKKQGPQANTSLSKNDYELSQNALQSTFAILSSFFNFLVQEQIVAANPVALIRQKSKFLVKHQQAAPVRRISNLQWSYVVETIEDLAEENPKKYERSLFIISCLLAMYLRISELVADERSTPMMGDFQKDQDGNWWFYVTGKGNKSRVISVCDEMLVALKRYRIFLGLSPLPTIGDTNPLVKKNLGKGPVTSTRQIRVLIQESFDQTYARMAKDGLKDEAQELKQATVHWLRHTGISEDIKIRPREHVRDDAGHATMQTTDRYIESDARERHASAKNKRIKDL